MDWFWKDVSRIRQSTLVDLIGRCLQLRLFPLPLKAILDMLCLSPIDGVAHEADWSVARFSGGDPDAVVKIFRSPSALLSMDMSRKAALVSGIADDTDNDEFSCKSGSTAWE